MRCFVGYNFCLTANLRLKKCHRFKIGYRRQYTSPQVAIFLNLWILSRLRKWNLLRKLKRSHFIRLSTCHIAFKIQNGPSSIKHTKWFRVAKTMPTPKITAIHLRKTLTHTKKISRWMMSTESLMQRIVAKKITTMLSNFIRILRFENSFGVNERTTERTVGEQ